MPLVFNYHSSAGSNKAQSGSPFSDQFFEHLGPNIDSNAANDGFQVVQRL